MQKSNMIKATKTKIKTEWDVSAVYRSGIDPKIEKDITDLEIACTAFAKKYSTNNEYLTGDDILNEALTEYERISSLRGVMMPGIYFYFLVMLDTTNQKMTAQLNTIEQRTLKITNSILFFTLNLGKIPLAQQKLFMESKKLTHFHYWLTILFQKSKYMLAEGEEKILSQKSLTSYTLWTQGMQKMLGKLTINYKGKILPLPQAQNLLASATTKDRTLLQKKITEALKSVSDFAESEINAVVTDKKITDELRGYTHSYSATILGYQNNENAIINFAKTVTDHFPIAHAFHTIKAQMLKLKTLTYADRGASVGGSNKKYSFTDAYEILFKSFTKTDPEFGKILQDMAESGRIDVYPRKGKRGGAWCLSTVNAEPHILLNHVDTMGSVMTFGHEMGHAIHGTLSKQQTALYEDHTTSVAEVASTFFENIVFQEVFETLSEKEKVITLHDRIQDDVQTVFRQIACFNFETALHAAIRERGALPKEEIAKLMNTHMKAYLGPKFKLTDDDGYFFVSWGHIRYFFYVYSYAYAQLISKALYKKYKENPAYITEIKKFLSAGGSKSPEDIFKDIGIDTTKPEFFIDGLKSIQNDIDTLKKLLKK